MMDMNEDGAFFQQIMHEDGAFVQQRTWLMNLLHTTPAVCGQYDAYSIHLTRVGDSPNDSNHTEIYGDGCSHSEICARRGREIEDRVVEDIGEMHVRMGTTYLFIGFMGRLPNSTDTVSPEWSDAWCRVWGYQQRPYIDTDGSIPEGSEARARIRSRYIESGGILTDQGIDLPRHWSHMRVLMNQHCIVSSSAERHDLSVVSSPPAVAPASEALPPTPSSNTNHVHKSSTPNLLR